MGAKKKLIYTFDNETPENTLGSYLPFIKRVINNFVSKFRELSNLPDSVINVAIDYTFIRKGKDASIPDIHAMLRFLDNKGVKDAESAFNVIMDAIKQ